MSNSARWGESVSYPVHPGRGHPELGSKTPEQLRPPSTTGPVSHSEHSGLGTNACSTARRARHERKCQHKGRDTNLKASAKGMTRMRTERAWRERERQRWLSVGGNIPPIPPPSNHRSWPRKHPKRDISLEVYNMWLLQDHQLRSLLRGPHIVGQLTSMTLDGCWRYLCQHRKALHWKADQLSALRKHNVLFWTCCNFGCVQLPPLNPHSRRNPSTTSSA